MPNKKFENFKFLRDIASEVKEGLSHEIAIYEKKRTKSSWYMKLLGTEINSAISEVIAQELFRLILPDHPKTRCVEKIVSTDNCVYYYVASKEIKDINPFYFVNEKNYCQDITSGKVKGLGAVQVISLWLNEIDFKAGNVVVNKEGNVIKLDGGQCFAGILEHIPSYGKRMFDITPGDLKSLPALTDYTPYNWLDFITHDQEETPHEKIINSYSKLLTIKNNDGFKNEVNQTILRIISLPDEFIRDFVENYVPNKDISIPLINNINERKQQLEKSALKIKNFRTYLSSLEASKEIEKQIQGFEGDLKNISFSKDSFLFSMNKFINRLNSLKGAPIPPPRNLPSFFPKIKARKKLITREEMLGTESNQIPLGCNRLHT